MGLRQAMEEHKAVATAIGVAFVGMAIGLVLWSTSSGIPSPLKKGYYSDDDGKTYFVDEVDKVVPFDHSGRPAVTAYVFRAGWGTPFVGILQQYNGRGHDELVKLYAQPHSGDVDAQITSVKGSTSELKRPGDGQWVSANSPAAQRMFSPVPPPGQTGDLQPVYP